MRSLTVFALICSAGKILSSLNFDSQLDDYKEGKIKLMDFLDLLPDEKDREFELYLTRLVEEMPSSHKPMSLT